MWGGLTGTEVGEAFGVGGLGLVGTGRTEYQVKAGTAIVWPDGKPAGQVTSDHAFSVGPREQAGNSCFDVPLTAAPAATIVLCFAPGDVAEITTPSGGGGVGVGGLGLIGAGGGGGTGSGYGVGSGSGFGSSGKKVPRVRQAKAAVKGSLDKDIIRRIVRAHINEVRYCYNQGLVKDPSLEGRVAVQFTISPAGSVPVAVVADSSIKDENVAKCIAKAVKRWKFPKPAGGGNVVVTYPFVLSPE
ncbi:MAG: TonB family protein [Myxococcales bacterium]|nr:TonB family protein [Myxococcales bacterium]